MKLYVDSLNLLLGPFWNSDILIGTIDENIHTEEYFQPSHFYYHDELTWCIQNSKPIPIWQNFFEICRDPTVWIIFIFTSFLATSAAYILQTFEDSQPKRNFLHESISVLGHFVGFVYPYKPKRISNRCFYIFGLFACIIFVSSFISIMMKIIHKPIFKNEVRSVQGIVNSTVPFEFTGDYFALQQLQKQKEVSQDDIIYWLFKMKIRHITYTEISTGDTKKIRNL